MSMLCCFGYCHLRSYFGASPMPLPYGFYTLLWAIHDVSLPDDEAAPFVCVFCFFTFECGVETAKLRPGHLHSSRSPCVPPRLSPFILVLSFDAMLTRLAEGPPLFHACTHAFKPSGSPTFPSILNVPITQIILVTPDTSNTPNSPHTPETTTTTTTITTTKRRHDDLQRLPHPPSRPERRSSAL
mmetsp:Transcript_36304/g.77312  ORF Transcript_36304/g.77312 Transcript_36304/m.77312 type:complete len:185 (+) Transcript_36304:339-893(+)